MCTAIGLENVQLVTIPISAGSATPGAICNSIPPGRLYLNSPGFGEGENLFVTLSNAETYARLQTVKRAYDPNNFFRMNQNVIPLLMPSAAGSWFGGFYLVAENSRREAPASPEPL